ncbi:MAG: hypothetical protein QM639_11640 [Rhodocyclaceae bacterium]
MPQQLVWVDIPALDLPRAIAFYSTVLAHAVHEQAHERGRLAVLPSGPGEASACLIEQAGLRPSMDGPLIYLSAEGRLDEAVIAAAACGGQVLEAPRAIGPFGYRALILDSEGNRIALYSSQP